MQPLDSNLDTLSSKLRAYIWEGRIVPFCQRFVFKFGAQGDELIHSKQCQNLKIRKWVLSSFSAIYKICYLQFKILPGLFLQCKLCKSGSKGLLFLPTWHCCLCNGVGLSLQPEIWDIRLLLDCLRLLLDSLKTILLLPYGSIKTVLKQL